MRVGIGYDVHKLVEGRKLIIGGLEIPFAKGLLGHSDADLLCHAIGDALLGAAGLGDLGEHFSDSDPKYKNISSLKLLEEILSLLKNKKLKIGYIDAVVIAQAPKISVYKEQMKKNISHALSIQMDQINLKATTEEGMGFTGIGQGMAAWAVVSLVNGE